jgi:hypothetical protein
MIVTWVTQDAVNESVVEYGSDSLNKVEYGTHDLFVDGGFQRRHLYIHRVQLSNLVPGTVYRKLTTKNKIYKYLSSYAFFFAPV